MKIQSLSVVVPTKNHCVNKCAFCVSRTHTNPYEDKIGSVVKFRQECNNGSKILLYNMLEYKDYFNRLQFARDNGCNVVVLTGTGEPIQNMKFIEFFSEVNSTLTTPFKSIEMQTTGVMLNDENLNQLRHLGVTTISFSISNIFDNEKNLEIIGCNEKLKFNVFEVIKLVKKHDFNLRLSLNLVNDYDKYTVEEVINRCEELGADQVTFRKLYSSDLNNDIDKWIVENASQNFYYDVEKYVRVNGKLLGVLPFGPYIYNIKDMSIVIDQDCMSEDNENKDSYKYLILRENAKLYTNWSTKSSLIF
jgi:MoaA/NifB/PqqE/SkfB family radical SAM enzyme